MSQVPAGASGSAMISTRVSVVSGTASICRGGDTSSPSQVYSAGMVSPSANAVEVSLIVAASVGPAEVAARVVMVVDPLSPSPQAVARSNLLRRRRWCGWFSRAGLDDPKPISHRLLPIDVTSQGHIVPAVRHRRSTELGNPQQVALAVFEIRRPDLSDRDNAVDCLEIG